MPVVSQSIIRPMVPVGARTVAWLLRTPNSSPPATASSQASWAADSRSAGSSSSSMSAAAARCWRSTPSMCSSLAAKPPNGPMRLAMRALVA